MPNNMIKHDGSSSSETVTGTPLMYVLGPAKNPFMFNGDVEGIYIRQDTGYRWIHDAPRSSGSGVRVGYLAR